MEFQVSMRQMPYVRSSRWNESWLAGKNSHELYSIAREYEKHGTLKKWKDLRSESNINT